MRMLIKSYKTLRSRHKEFSSGSSYNDNFKIYLAKSLKYWLLYGASPNDILMYKLGAPGVNARDYMTMRRYYKMLYYFNPNFPESMFLNKYEFNQMFLEFINRKFQMLDEFSVEGEEAITSRDGYIVKPVRGEGGSDIHVFESKSEVIEFSRNIKKTDEWIVEELVRNHQDISRFGSRALSTIRVGTISLKRECKISFPGVLQRNNVVFIAACIRFGSVDGVVDNLTSGGVACPVNLNTGELGCYGVDKYNTQYSKAPASGVKFSGHKIPEWNKVLDTIENACKQLPKDTRYIGWDIAVLDNGKIELIEANDNGSHRPLQLASSHGIWPLYKHIMSERL